MYAGTQINWFDQSGITTQIDTADPNPIVRYLCLITSDKGTEKLTTLYGNDWYDMYGANGAFANHGQPLIQAQKIIEAGGVCVTKRLVANDATLGNLALVAKVTAETREKMDAGGNPLYIDPVTGNETTEAGDGNARATYQVAVISHGFMSLEGAKNSNEVLANADQATMADTGVYPLYVFCDNGRGNTGKKISVAPEYSVSKNSKYMIYTVKEIEGSTIVERQSFTINPYIIYGNKSYALSKDTMSQVDCYTLSDNVTAFVNAVAAITGYGADYLLSQDFLFGKNTKGNQIEGIEFDESSADITADYGVELQNGSNGSFGDSPFGTKAWEDAIVAYISGDVTDEIYDNTICDCDVVFGANYPERVNAAIEEFVNWREDLFFFRDLGLDLTTYEAIFNKVYDSECSVGKFSAIYCTSYDIYDPLTKKPIQVTMNYGMAPLMVEFFKNGRNRPLCGGSNGMTITDYIPGTVRFTPRITPKVNQKSLLEDLRVNYAAKIDSATDALTIETCYTSQEAYTQASYINNILAIQQVVKAIRNYSPTVRYQFYTGSDFSDYAKIIDENVLKGYSSQFKSLELVYTQDDLMAAQKIFKASLRVACGTFIQTEVYDVFIIE